jgi:hypothetical protein
MHYFGRNLTVFNMALANQCRAHGGTYQRHIHYKVMLERSVSDEHSDTRYKKNMNTYD